MTETIALASLGWVRGSSSPYVWGGGQPRLRVSKCQFSSVCGVGGGEQYLAFFANMFLFPVYFRELFRFDSFF